MKEHQSQTLPARSGVKSFLTYRLSRLHYNLDSHAKAILSKHADLSLIEWRIISLINHDVETTMPDILTASRIGEDRLSRNLQNLVDKAYVLSCPSAAGKGPEILSLSPEGKSLHSELLPHMVIRQTQLTDGLSVEEMNALDHILDKLDSAAVDMKNSVV